jgi:hypothetical protein
VTVQFLNAIIELVNAKIAESENPGSIPLYNNTMKYLARMKREQPQKYGELKF